MTLAKEQPARRRAGSLQLLDACGHALLRLVCRGLRASGTVLTAWWRARARSGGWRRCEYDHVAAPGLEQRQQIIPAGKPAQCYFIGCFSRVCITVALCGGEHINRQYTASVKVFRILEARRQLGSGPARQRGATFDKGFPSPLHACRGGANAKEHRCHNSQCGMTTKLGGAHLGVAASRGLRAWRMGRRLDHKLRNTKAKYRARTWRCRRAARAGRAS